MEVTPWRCAQASVDSDSDPELQPHALLPVDEPPAPPGHGELGPLPWLQSAEVLEPGSRV